MKAKMQQKSRIIYCHDVAVNIEQSVISKINNRKTAKYISITITL